MENENQGSELTDQVVIGIIEAELENSSLGYGQSLLAERRRRSISYYHGDPFGNEQEGRSSVVLTDARDTIEWILPTLLELFTSSPNIVRYGATRSDHEEAAEQATQFVNYDFMKRRGGFLFLHNWFKAALIEGNQVALIDFERKITRSKETYRGITQTEMAMLLSDETLEPVALTQNETAPGVMLPDGTMSPPVALFDVQVSRTTRRGEITARLIPNEDFFISQRAVSIDDAPLVGYRTRLTRSDLRGMGFDPAVVDSLEPEDTPDFEPERLERHERDDGGAFIAGDDVSDSNDRSRDRLWISVFWSNIDVDQDGHAELRRFVCAGGGKTGLKLLESCECSRKPLVDITPVPMPHKYHGLSEVDLVADLQLIRSHILRQMLDNIYLTNNSRVEVVEDQVEIDDLLSPRPGGVVRVRAPGMIRELAVGGLGPMPFNMLEYLHGVKENRTGITRYNQGSDASSLNQTATGISKIMQAANMRVKMVARVFSEMGLKRFFSIYKDLIVENADELRGQLVKLRGEWVEVDPSSWSQEMDVNIDVGLGASDMDAQIANLSRVVELQGMVNAAGLGGLLITPDNAYAALSALVEKMGFMKEGMFFTDPQGQTPEPQPDPDAEKAQAEIERMKARLALDARKLQSDEELAKARLAQEREMAMAKLASEREIKLIELKLQTERAAVEHKHRSTKMVLEGVEREQEQEKKVETESE